MSRVGKSPIPLPSGVSAAISGSEVTVTGPKGTLQHRVPEAISVVQDGEALLVARADDERRSRALHGLTRALLNNMVAGVHEGYRKDLEIVGVGYRAAAKSPRELELQLGFSHPVTVEAPEGITFEVPSQTVVRVLGIDKQAVGQVAAQIRALRKPEPYKGKGIRYAGEHIRRKAGKAAK
ncbi:MAG: 50S ribosomal protein L6 [Acidimicrobiia bacterium]|nr:50S ribosomal protein L6 [bacterium]MXZ31665.1 50S ribosomal protein L6 [Acidimicrobiia bacterium]MYB24843.1 50S ribosomal protein L6 [Acidimicrobiia bacterium]MYE67829.1 50S ribosomal protein L6 [Acidimicrobiia bacterium]MYJ13056.1 50S ribosomal protein L6 [Acidimicrobiia bacterium]